MKKMYLLTSLLASTLVVGGISASKGNAFEAKAEELSLQSEGDAFRLLDKSYNEDESFVYTADMHFRNGQAAGLAFGAKENDHYFVINIDRNENHIKLLYFSRGENSFVDELYVCDFIGNSINVQPYEWDMINPLVRNIETVNFKVVLTREDSHAYAEFYVEGIKRFGVDTVIDLNDLGKSYSYEGGYIGMNCFNADVYLNNIEYGKSDYSYFSEPYRNQYHFQPFSKWTNDPNGLCYFNGWYHVFYQTNPFGLLWGDMFWGHARSRDLIHFEYLPICLFPETGNPVFGSDTAWMWSGCAISYYHGMSEDIDNLGWFDSCGGDGILAIYTRDGMHQHQQIIYSTDEGLTWNKTSYIINQHLIDDESDGKKDWRDPKVFPLTKDDQGKVTTWGMTLASYALNKGWFLKSTNLLNWELAGSFAFPTPECIGVGFIRDNLGKEHAYLTNKSRTYILGQIEYNGGDVIFRDQSGVDISTYSLEEMQARLKPLDFGPDSYASQSFYINDESSEFNGKDIVLNWFSGDLNASFCTGPGEYAGLRGRWNGGFTVPVSYGVYRANDEYRISQKPITVNNAKLEKTPVVNLSDLSLSSSSDNPLRDVHTHVFEMEASITVSENSPITFKVDVGNNEFMQLGWNEVDGYYVDRTYLDDKGINTNVDWHTKYASHILGDSDTKTFYVLSDNGGLEVFCENYSVSFYFVTTAAMSSTGASLKADNAHINTLKLNEVKSVYRGEIEPGEGKLYVSNTDVVLDTELASEEFVSCWHTGGLDLTWEELNNEEVVATETSNQGINLVALKEGTASFKVSAGDHEEIINVTVHDSTFTSDLTFKKDGIVSGNWIMQEDAIVGEKLSGNAFLLAEEVSSDFTYAGQFDILSGTAAALVFRAASDMSSYLVANYDAGAKVVKLWSTHGALAEAKVDVGTTNIGLTVKTSGRLVSVTINGNTVLNYTLPENEPLSGHFGLNVFSGKAKFKSLSLVKENYEYTSGDLSVKLNGDDLVTGVYNLTLGNVKVEPGYYSQSNGTLLIHESYFELLPGNGLYEFKIVTTSLSFSIKVEVNMSSIEAPLEISDVTVEKGNNVVVYVGTTPITSVSVNGNLIDKASYVVNNYTLSISYHVFNEGENTVLLNGDVSFKVTVINKDEEVIDKDDEEPEEAKKKSGFGAWLANLFKKIGEFFKNLFGGKKK